MAFWVYIAECADGRYYTGQTDNLEVRIAQHHQGGYCDFTSRRRPLTFKWCENFPSRLEALEAKRRIKPWSRAKKEGLIAGDWPRVSHFARPPKERPSTSLGTNGKARLPEKSVRAERSRGTLSEVGLDGIEQP